MRPCALAWVAALLGLLPGSASAGVEVQARLQRSMIVLGESASLEVVVSGALTGVHEPEIGLPSGLEVLGTGRAESVQISNGKLSRQVVFRIEIGAERPGQYTIGPIRVQVGGTSYLSGTVRLVVSAAGERLGAPVGRAASLVSEVEPRRAWVGEELLLSVKLIQRAPLAEDPEYAPPATPGFWSDRASQPESYYADAGGSRVMVTETRTRLYPLAAGRLVIGPAQAQVVLESQREMDPFGLLPGRSARRAFQLRSDSLVVHVSPLPTPAPAGFGGGVGEFQARWWTDRRGAALDAPFTVTLELRGSGNLPLIKAPPWSSPDFEVYACSTDDSLGVSGTHESGRKRIVWTLLARRTGPLELRAPALVWFSPREGRYRQAELDPLELRISPPALSRETPTERFPEVFLRYPAEPGKRPAQPWAWALAGILLGGGVLLWRRAAAPLPASADRAQLAEWIRALESPARRPEWWRTADQAAAWLAARGRLVHHLRLEIQGARYGGESVKEARVRAKLIESLLEVAPARAVRWPLQIGGLVMVLAALALAWLTGPGPPEEARVVQARQIEEWARRGEWEKARSAWEEMWRESPDAAVAARIAWSWAQAGEMGWATLWTLRGRLEDDQEPGLRWVSQRVREAGGLVGAPGGGWWPPALAFALVALIAAAVMILLVERRPAVAAAAALAVALAAALPVRMWIERRTPRVVVMREAALVTSDGDRLTLEAGQSLRMRTAAGERVGVEAGPGVSGTVERGALAWVTAPAGAR